METPLRKVERLIENDWHLCQMSELNKGDIFRLTEPDGEIVGKMNWLATAEPKIITNPNGVETWGVDAEGVTDD